MSLRRNQDIVGAQAVKVYELYSILQRTEYPRQGRGVPGSIEASVLLISVASTSHTRAITCTGRNEPMTSQARRESQRSDAAERRIRTGGRKAPVCAARTTAAYLEEAGDLPVSA
jgi:hypothetical protein